MVVAGVGGLEDFLFFIGVGVCGQGWTEKNLIFRLEIEACGREVRFQRKNRSAVEETWKTIEESRKVRSLELKPPEDGGVFVFDDAFEEFQAFPVGLRVRIVDDGGESECSSRFRGFG